MKRLILRVAGTLCLVGFALTRATADTQTATAALNAPLVNIGGNSDFEWGPIVSTTNMSLQGASDVHYPQKFAGGMITASGGNAGNNTYCQNGPDSDGKEYFCGLNPAPGYPHINFSDYRQLAQLQGNSCAGQPCLNPTNLSGIQDSVCQVNGHPKVWFFDGSPKFTGSTSFCGVLVSLGAVNFNGSGTGIYTVTPPADAWKQYQVGTPNGVNQGPDTAASNEYPGDSGFESSNTPVTLTGVSFNGYVYTTNGYSAAGGAIIVGAVQFGAGASSTHGGATIYFSSQSVIVEPPAGQVDQPIINPGGGCSSSPVTVTIIDGTQGASMYYTLDGSTPDQNATPYTGPFTLNTTNPSVTVTAIAIKAGMTNSATASATFTFSSQCSGGGTNPPPSITFSANPTSITTGGSSTLSWTISNATTASIDQGIGSVSSVSGNRTVSPIATTVYTLTASGPGGTSTAQATVTVNNVPPPTIQFSANSYTVSEDAGFAGITVTRQGSDLSGTSTVHFHTVDGSAKAGVDYTSTSGLLTFGANETTKTFDVPVINDGAADGPEDVNLVLDQPTGATLGLSAAVLTITDQNPLPPPPPNPIINQLIPYSAPVNQSQSFILRVLGANFDATSGEVIWNANISLPVLSRSSTEIDVTVDPSIWNATAGPYPVIVHNVSPTPADSNQAIFTVQPVGAGNPAPSLTALVPNSKIAGSSAFTLTLKGENFQNGAVVSWNGSDRVTTFVDITQLTASISAADVLNAGSVNVSVRNPDQQISNALPFKITAPVPVLTSIEVVPPQATLGVGGQLLFQAQGYDQTHTLIDGVTFTWSMTGSNSITPTSGSSTTLVTAGNTAGTYTLTAASGSIQGQAQVTVQGDVNNGWLTAVSTAVPNPVTGTTTHLHVTAASSDPGPISYTWTFSGLASNIQNPTSADTDVVFPQPGTYSFQVLVVDSQGLRLTSRLTVTVLATISSVVVSPAQTIVPVGQSFNGFSAKAFDQFNIEVNTSFTWSASAGTINSVTGSYQAGSTPQNNITVTATAPNGVSGNAFVNVQGQNAGSGSFDLGNAKVYPIPFKSTDAVPGITFAGLPPGTEVKVYTLSARMVWNDFSQGQNIVWQKPLLNRNSQSVASGVYFYRITNSVSGQSRQGKLVIIQ